MSQGSYNNSGKHILSRISAIGKCGISVTNVICEQPKSREDRNEGVTSGSFLPISTVANRKSGFSSRGKLSCGSRLALERYKYTEDGESRSSQDDPLLGRRAWRPESTDGLAVDSDSVLLADARTKSPADVDMCMGLNGLVLVGDEDDILVKGNQQRYVSVRVAITELVLSPWRKYYQRPPLNTPGLLAIGEAHSWLEHCLSSPCLSDWLFCCSDSDRAVETLLVFHANDIAVALNYCMQCAKKGDSCSPLHNFVQELKDDDALESRLVVKWIAFDETFAGVEYLKESQPIHAQAAEHLGYWPRFNYYDHCQDIVQGIYTNDIYDPEGEYGMGRRLVCSECSYWWRGGVPDGEGWNQRDENYYQ